LDDNKNLSEDIAKDPRVIKFGEDILERIRNPEPLVELSDEERVEQGKELFGYDKTTFHKYKLQHPEIWIAPDIELESNGEVYVRAGWVDKYGRRNYHFIPKRYVFSLFEPVEE